MLDVEPSGDGEHDWLWLEKRAANTAWVARQLARIAGVPARDAGFAGMKDRHAVTRQWFSVRRPRGGNVDWRAADIPGVTVLDVRRHARKLKRGAHRGNRFDLLLRDLVGDPCPALARIAVQGVPNYFGEQRFGRGASNLGLIDELLAGRRLRREQRSIALSAARALLFNAVLDRRVETACWDRLLPGDLAILDGSSSHFSVSEVDAELARRCRDFDLHPSGPLWGRGEELSQRAAPEREALAAHADMAAGLERLCDAARRPLRLRVAELGFEHDGATLRVSFVLAAGGFATAVLREVVAYVDAASAAA